MTTAMMVDDGGGDGDNDYDDHNGNDDDNDIDGDSDDDSFSVDSSDEFDMDLAEILATIEAEEKMYIEHMQRKQKKATADELRRKGPLTGLSLGAFGPEHPFRVGVAYVSRHRWFEYIILFCIVVSSLMLAWDEPLLEKG